MCFCFDKMAPNLLGPMYLLSCFNCLTNETVRYFFWPKGTVKKNDEDKGTEKLYCIRD